MPPWFSRGNLHSPGLEPPSAEKAGQSVAQTCRISGPTLPNHEHLPIGGAQRSKVFNVSLSISFPLGEPIVHVAHWGDPPMAAFVQVPETTVNEDDFASRDKDKVWLPWKVLAMKRIAIAQGMCRLSDAHFRNSVLAPHSTHTGAPLFCREVVSHQAGPQKPVLGRLPRHP